MKNTYYGKILNGQLRIVNRKIFDKDIAMMEGKEVEIIVAKKTKKRSPLQNRYYWGVVVSMIKEVLIEMGHDELTSEEVHDFLRNRFLVKEIVNETTAEIVSIPMSTTETTTTEFMTYIDKCVKFGAEFLSISIPEPNYQAKINYKSNEN